MCPGISIDAGGVGFDDLPEFGRKARLITGFYYFLRLEQVNSDIHCGPSFAVHQPGHALDGQELFLHGPEVIFGGHLGDLGIGGGEDMRDAPRIAGDGYVIRIDLGRNRQSKATEH